MSDPWGWGGAPAPAPAPTGEIFDPMEIQFNPQFQQQAAAPAADPWGLPAPGPAPAPVWGAPAPAPAPWGAPAPAPAGVDPRLAEFLKKTHAETKLKLQKIMSTVRAQGTKKVENMLPRRRPEDEALTLEENFIVIKENYVAKTAAAAAKAALSLIHI